MKNDNVPNIGCCLKLRVRLSPIQRTGSGQLGAAMVLLHPIAQEHLTHVVIEGAPDKKIHNSTNTFARFIVSDYWGYKTSPVTCLLSTRIVRYGCRSKLSVAILLYG